jgi:pantoate--beta-alanine ligase
MRTIRTTQELRRDLFQARCAGRTIGLVPTMGAFHEGHLSLMRRARADCDIVVVSLFVNPTQFNDSADLAAYPRDERGDAATAQELGVDYLFAPPAEEVYPSDFATTVSVSGLTERMEGRFRGPGHFDGVTTVVAKLLNMVSPDVAYFGQKDAQQTVVVKRLVRDLNIPVHVEVCPTIREADGLAMSSRNGHLSVDDRRRAPALNRALSAVRESIAAGERDPQAAIAAGRRELSAWQIEPEYLELVVADTLAPAERIEGDLLVLVAARFGTTRLIDNHLIELNAAGQGARSADSTQATTNSEREVATVSAASTIA